MDARAGCRSRSSRANRPRFEIADSYLAGRAAEIRAIAMQHGASNVRVFGSQARGEANDGSDLDLLVTFERGRTLLDLVSLKQDLEELLACRVDVLTEGGLSPYIRERVLREAVPL